MPKLQHYTPDSPIDAIDKEQEAWISSLIAIGALVSKLKKIWLFFG